MAYRIVWAVYTRPYPRQPAHHRRPPPHRRAPARPVIARNEATKQSPRPRLASFRIALGRRPREIGFVFEHAPIPGPKTRKIGFVWRSIPASGPPPASTVALPQIIRFLIHDQFGGRLGRPDWLCFRACAFRIYRRRAPSEIELCSGRPPVIWVCLAHSPVRSALDLRRSECAGPLAHVFGRAWLQCEL
jgi:hypothetical protein